MKTTEDLQIVRSNVADMTTASCPTDGSCDCRLTNDTPSENSQKNGTKAAVVGLLCVLGCLAAPLLIGGVAALSSVISGEAWILVVGVTAAVVVGVVLKRRGKGSIC